MSKDIATLENEILELKCVLEEFKTPPNDLNMGLGMTTKSSLCESNILSEPYSAAWLSRRRQGIPLRMSMDSTGIAMGDR